MLKRKSLLVKVYILPGYIILSWKLKYEQTFAVVWLFIENKLFVTNSNTSPHEYK